MDPSGTPVPSSVSLHSYESIGKDTGVQHAPAPSQPNSAVSFSAVVEHVSHASHSETVETPQLQPAADMQQTQQTQAPSDTSEDIRANKEEDFQNAMQFMNSLQFVGDMTRAKGAPLLDTIKQAGPASGLSPQRAARIHDSHLRELSHAPSFPPGPPQMMTPPIPEVSNAATLQFQEGYLMREMQELQARRVQSSGGIVDETIRSNLRAAGEASQIFEKYGLLDQQAGPQLLHEVSVRKSLSPLYECSQSPLRSYSTVSASLKHRMVIEEETSRVIAKSADFCNLLELTLGDDYKKKKKKDDGSLDLRSLAPTMAASSEAVARVAVENAIRSLPSWGGPDASSINQDPLLQQAMLEALCVKKDAVGSWEPDKKVLKSFKKTTDAALQVMLERQSVVINAEEETHRSRIESLREQEFEHIKQYSVVEEARAWDEAVRGEVSRKRQAIADAVAQHREAEAAAASTSGPSCKSPRAASVKLPLKHDHSSVDPTELTHWLIGKGWSPNEAAAFALQSCVEADERFAAAVAASAPSPQHTFLPQAEFQPGAPPTEELRLGDGWVRKEERLQDGTSLFNWVRE